MGISYHQDHRARYAGGTRKSHCATGWFAHARFPGRVLCSTTRLAAHGREGVLNCSTVIRYTNTPILRGYQMVLLCKGIINPYICMYVCYVSCRRESTPLVRVRCVEYCTVQDLTRAVVTPTSACVRPDENNQRKQKLGMK